MPIDPLELKSVKLGKVRIGGYLGHAVASLRGIVSGRRFWLGFGWIASFALFAIGGVRIYKAWHEYEMQSPIEKGVYIVEDTRSDGAELEVRFGTDHLKLFCHASKWNDPDKGWQSDLYGKCYIYKPGDRLKFEKWDEDTYVYKTTGVLEVKNEDGKISHKTVDVEDEYTTRLW